MSRLDDLARELDADECAAVEKIRRCYAKRYLVEFRAMLQPFNLSRHNVTISSGMGSACLCINGRVWDDNTGSMAGVVCELRAINANLSYEWADYVHGKSLTH